MKLSFEPNLEFQRVAIKSVTDLFIGQSTASSNAYAASCGELNPKRLKTDEQLKIQCGLAHYTEFSDLAYKVVKTPGQLNNL